MKRLAPFLLLWILGGGCISAPKIPAWAGKNWQEKQVFYFSGISPTCSNVSCAKEEAYNNAVASITTFLGSTVSVVTESELDNSGQYFNTHFKSSTQKVPLKHLHVEKFQISRYKKNLVGYILLSIKTSEINAILNQIEQNTARQAEQQKSRHQLGVIRVHTTKGWKDLEGQMTRFLSKAGYCTGENGNDLLIQVDNFTCIRSQIQDIQICTLQARVRFKQKNLVYISKGYGRVHTQARQDAIKAWLEQIQPDFLEEQ